MPSIQLPLLLLCLTLSGVCPNGGQPHPEESENMVNPKLDDILQRSESLLQSALRNAKEMNKETCLQQCCALTKQLLQSNEAAACLSQKTCLSEPNAPMPEWLSKRQHSGKKYLSDLVKRQHPGKRDAEEDTSYGDTQKRQYPGKGETDDDLDSYLELKKRQHPGRRWLLDQDADTPAAQPTYLNQLPKRQHPGRRYLMSKWQHPSRRGWNDELELNEQYGEEHQHPGKKPRNSDSPEDAGPCSFQELFTCNKGSLLLDLVESVSKDRVEEKRQHPGKRSVRESETEE